MKEKLLILKIDNYRTKLGISKNELSKRANMQMTPVAALCNNTNKSDPPFFILKKFADIFGVQMKDLFDEIL